MTHIRSWTLSRAQLAFFFRMACEIINRWDENTVYFSRCNKKKLRGETEGKAKKINEREEEKKELERERR